MCKVFVTWVNWKGTVQIYTYAPGKATIRVLRSECDIEEKVTAVSHIYYFHPSK